MFGEAIKAEVRYSILAKWIDSLNGLTMLCMAYYSETYIILEEAI